MTVDDAKARRRSVPALLAVLAVALAACTPASAKPPPASRPAMPRVTVSAPAELAAGCSDDTPCRYGKGTVRLGRNAVLPGLRLTIPSTGWTSPENDEGELNLLPPGMRDAHLMIWTDMKAVKSSGPGHGTPLGGVDSDAASLVAWLDGNPDLLVRETPPRTIAGTPMTSRIVTPSKTVRFGDPECPANPRCAAIVSQPDWWGDEFFAIGYPETAHLFIAGPVADRDNLIVALDAPDPAALARLTVLAGPVIDSLRLP